MKIQLNIIAIIISVLVLMSCGDIREKANEKLDLLDGKVEKLDSVINSEIDKVEQLDSMINREVEKVNRLDSLIEDKSSKADSILRRR